MLKKIAKYLKGTVFIKSVIFKNYLENLNFLKKISRKSDFFF